MTRPVHQHPRVEVALENAYAWWAKHRSPSQAACWYNGFLEAIAVPRKQPLSYEVRELHFGAGAKPTHRALYVIRPEMVYVISVRHLTQRPVTPDDLD